MTYFRNRQTIQENKIKENKSKQCHTRRNLSLWGIQTSFHWFLEKRKGLIGSIELQNRQCSELQREKLFGPWGCKQTTLQCCQWQLFIGKNPKGFYQQVWEVVKASTKDKCLERLSLNVFSNMTAVFKFSVFTSKHVC